MMTMKINGFDLGPRDFGNDRIGYVAWSMAANAAVMCRDKESAIELWRYEAERVVNGELLKDAIEAVRETTEAPNA